MRAEINYYVLGHTGFNIQFKKKRTLKAYIYEGIEVEKSGLKVKLKKTIRI